MPTRRVYYTYMDGRVSLARPLGDGAHLGQGHDGPVKRVFQADNSGRRVVVSVRQGSVLFHVC